MTHYLLFILGVCSCFFTFAQKAEVELSVSTTSAEVGETVIIKIETNIDGEFQIDNLPSTFSYGGAISSGVNYQMDYNTGDVMVIYTHAQNGVFSKPGTYKIGPAYIKSRSGDSYVSNMITVRVGKKVQLNSGHITNQQLSDPAFGVIQTSKNTIYEGEPIVVAAKVYSLFQPTRIGNYQTFIQGKGIEHQPLTSSARQLKVTEERFRGNEYFVFEYDRHVIFPSGIGVFTLDAYMMDLMQGFKGFSLTSSSANIQIKPLPGNAPKDFIGAVGKFNVVRTIDTNNVKQGEVFRLILTVDGIGNIQNILEPELNLPKGMIVYGDPIIDKQISYGVNGGEGSIRYEFNIQVTTHGNIEIPATSISYFDPTTAKYVNVSTDKHSIHVVKDNSFIAADSHSKNPNEEIYSENGASLRKVKDVRSTSTIFGTPLFWSGLGAPLFCAFLFVLYARRREQSADEIESKLAIQQKDKQLGALVESARSLLTIGENDAFYSSVEHALRKAFECKMGITDKDRILSKEEMFSYLVNSHQESLSSSVSDLFRTCEESRFGFGMSNDLRQPAFDQLQSILKSLGV